jgi:hypothetical protein
MAPVATHHFSLPFHPPWQLYPDQPNLHLLPVSNRLKAFPTLISLRAGLWMLDIFLFAIVIGAIPEIFTCTFELTVDEYEKEVGTAYSILATPPAYIRYQFYLIFSYLV